MPSYITGQNVKDGTITEADLDAALQAKINASSPAAGGNPDLSKATGTLDVAHGGTGVTDATRGPFAPVVNVKAYGAVGDGVTDDFEAIQDAKAALPATGGHLFFPAGTYRIGRYVGDLHGTTANDLLFDGFSNLTISGAGAKILMQPPETVTRSAGDSETTVPLRPFTLLSCQNVTIEGLELDGSGASWRKAASDQGECANGYGVYLSECTNVTLRDLYAHGFITDGVTVTGATKACRNVVFDNCRCENNARNGASIIQAKGVQRIGGSYSNNGTIDGYGGHLEGVGWCVEPDVYPPAIDVATGDVVKLGGTEEGNAGTRLGQSYGTPKESEHEGPRTGPFVGSKAFTIQFPASVDPQQVDLALPDGVLFWGIVRATVAGTYNSDDACGGFVKTFGLGLSAEGTAHLNTATTTAVFGDNAAYRLDVVWTGTAWAFRLTSRLAMTGVNEVTVRLEAVTAQASSLGYLMQATQGSIAAGTAGDAEAVSTVPTATLATTATTANNLPASLTGLVKATAGVPSAAVAGTDYLAPNGNGSALTNLSAANVTGANTLPDGVLSTNVPLRNAANTFSASQTIAGSNLYVKRDTSTGQLIVQGSADTNKQLILGYDTTNDRSFIQSVHQSSGYRNLALNPSGGNVGINNLSPSSLLDVKGTDTSTTKSIMLHDSAGAEAFSVTNAGIATAKTKFSAPTLDVSGTVTATALASSTASLGTGTATSLNLKTDLSAFGDSITYGVGTSGNAARYTDLLAARLGGTLTNNGVSSHQAWDQADAVYATTTAAGRVSTMLIGTNDIYQYGSSAALMEVFRSALQSEVAYLATLPARRVTGQAATKVGSWTPYGAYRASTTQNGATATATVYGTTIYIGTVASRALNSGAFSVTVDGVAYGPYDTYPSANPVTQLGRNYGPMLIRIPNLSDGPHTVVVAKTGGTTVWVDYIAGNAGSAYENGPAVYVGTISRAPSYAAPRADSDVLAYNALIRRVVDELASDGLNVCLADTYRYIDITTDLSDGLHWNDTGHQHGRDAFLVAMNGFATAGDRQRAARFNAINPVAGPVTIPVAAVASGDLSGITIQGGLITAYTIKA